MKRLVARFDEIADKVGSRERAGADALRGGRRGVAHRDRGEARRGRPADLGGDPEPARRRACRCRSTRRSATHARRDRERLPAAADRRRQGDRLAVQHVQDRGAATDADRERHRGVARGGAPPGRRARTSTTSSRTRTGSTRSRRRSRSTTATSPRRGPRVCCDAPVGGRPASPASSVIPSSHSRSPAIHNAAFAALGLDWVFVAFHVPQG